MVKEIALLKGNLCDYKMFHRRLIHFGIVVQRKITKCAPIGDGAILWRNLPRVFSADSLILA